MGAVNKDVAQTHIDPASALEHAHHCLRRDPPFEDPVLAQVVCIPCLTNHMGARSEGFWFALAAQAVAPADMCEPIRFL